MNDVVVMVETNRRNNLTANFSRDQRPVQRSVLRFAVQFTPTENAFLKCLSERNVMEIHLSFVHQAKT